jgi:HSP20 family protein
MAKEEEMAVTRWTPFSAFTSLEREMQGIVDRLGARSLVEGFAWKPSTDVYEHDDRLVVRVELPGVDPQTEIKVEVKENMLHISGEKRSEKETTEDDHYMRECRYGSYHRDLLLPEGVDPEGVRATYDRGILTVMVPMPSGEVQEPHTTKIDIETPALASAPTV